jgi:hypothetical protein
MCHSAWACGIGRRVLDELAKNVRGKMGRAGTLATSEAFHQQYAKAEGTYRAARALVYEAWNEVRDTLERNERLSTRQHTLIRLAMAHATWSAHEVAMFAYASAGTVALRSGTLQRLFRDMHAGIQHVTSSPPVFQAIGRDLAGLAPSAEWRFLDLVSASPSA